MLVRRAFQLLKVSVARNRRSLTLMISCPAAALDCTGGKAKLATAKKVARPAARRKRILALGSATFAIRSGTAATVKLKLNRTARKLLARGRIKGKLTLSVGDSPAKPLLTTRDLTIRPPARKRR